MFTIGYGIGHCEDTGFAHPQNPFNTSTTDDVTVSPTSWNDGMLLGIVARTFHGIACHLISDRHADAAQMAALFKPGGSCSDEIRHVPLRCGRNKHPRSAADAFDRIARYIDHGQFKSAYAVAREAYKTLAASPGYVEWSEQNTTLHAAQSLPEPRDSGICNLRQMNVA